MNATHVISGVLALGGAYVANRWRNRQAASLEITSVETSGSVITVLGTDQRGRLMSVYLDNKIWYRSSTDETIDADTQEALNQALRAFNRRKRDAK